MRSNFHTHTKYCDGKDTPGEMAEEALSLGFFALGFSGHWDPPFSSCGMTSNGAAAYRREIAALKKQYAGRMEIYCGVEQDILSGFRSPEYDYAIGSVHWIEKDGRHLSVDWKEEIARQNITAHYGGDACAYAEDYYALVAQVKDRTGCDIIGHFDLLTKFDEEGRLFSPDMPRYRAAVLNALDALASPGQIFEINTGAMARGYRTTPYPALWILRELKRRRCSVMLSSDCHDRKNLTCGFETARNLALEAGFDSQIVLKNGRFQEVAV